MDGPKINRFYRWRHFEFWPFQVFYFPMMLYGIWLALRSGSFTYFSAANPGFAYGGAFDMSKSDALTGIDPRYVPPFLLIREPGTFTGKDEEGVRQKIGYPLVAKPDIGERGKNVEFIRTSHELFDYMEKASGPVILQEFAVQPREAGILFYRMPDGSERGITSVVLREFLAVTGNGVDTLAKLVGMRERSRNRIGYLKSRFAGRWEEVIPKGERIILEPIGNHNRGALFLNGNHLITPVLVDAIDNMTKNIDGFFYGRLDVKFDSDEDLKKGKGIVVLEVNGVNSEPAHIYHPGTPLFYAYKVIIRHMRLIRRIARLNHRQYGVKYAPLLPMFRDLLRHGNRFEKRNPGKRETGRIQIQNQLS